MLITQNREQGEAANEGKGKEGKSMKEYYMVIERDEDGWYVGSIPELPGCHTQGETIEELTERMKEAISLYLDEADESVAGSSAFIGVHRVSVA
jgi:predicted RNase H-like HicB family nuclease